MSGSFLHEMAVCGSMHTFRESATTWRTSYREAYVGSSPGIRKDRLNTQMFKI